MDRWSLAFGDLADENPEHFFMGNPVWSRPMIRLKDDVPSFFVPVIGLFVSFCLEMMEAIIEDEPDLCERYQARRGVFLEAQTERLFREAFPTSKVFCGSQWQDPISNKSYENDLLVLIDSYMIVVEAKAGKVSAQARRGAELSLQRDINKLIIEPSEQAGRFVDYLLKNRGVNHFTTRRGAINEVDTTHVYEIVRLNVTLDMLANVQSNWTELRSAGFVPQSVDPAPTMSLADLETVFELLDGACEKLHYLVRRTELERNTSYFADEIDLLAFYIDTGFNIGDIEFDDVRMFLYGASEFLEPYLVRAWSGQNVAKPRRRYTKWWDALMIRIESQPFSRWTECGYLLLNMTYGEQVHFERQFRQVQRSVGRRALQCNRTDLGDTFIMPYGPERRRNLLIGFAYEGITRAQRNDAMTDAAMIAFRGQSADRALVLGVNLEQVDKGKPYSIMGCFSRSHEDASP